MHLLAFQRGDDPQEMDSKMCTLSITYFRKYNKSRFQKF